MPGNEIRFFFGAHRTLHDAEAGFDDYHWCTVYCPEGTDYGDTNRELYRYLSDGRLDAATAYGLLPGGHPMFNLGQYLMIEGSGKRIELIDVPNGHPVTERLHELATVVVGVGHLDGDFRAVREQSETALREFVAANRERERYIVDQLQRLDAELSGERILVRLGVCHFRAGRLAALCGLPVETVFQRSGHLGLDGLCYHFVNCGAAIPRPFLERYILGAMLLKHVPALQSIRDAGRREQELWRLARAFGSDDVADLWQRCHMARSGARDVMVGALRARGFTEYR